VLLGATQVVSIAGAAASSVFVSPQEVKLKTIDAKTAVKIDFFIALVYGF
jgi:hypothetical protein